nr:NADH-quinone oxidoreductase subunit NuoE [Pseudomonadota bacterium]
VIRGLMAAQEQNGGWLTDELIAAVAKYLEIPAVWAYEVATFYSMYALEPVGRHEVAICTNISCWLNGAEDIVRHCEKKLGVKLGESTGDGRVYLKMEEECLAACTGAPMMMVDGHYHENLTAEKVDRILESLE